VDHEYQTIAIALPQDSLAPIAETPEGFAQEMRLAAAMLWFTQGRISHERAAQYAGLSRIAFLDALAATKLAAFQAGPGESREAGRHAVASTEETARTRDTEQGGPSTESQESGADLRFTLEAAEAHYRPLGRSKGDLAAGAVQDAAREFWQSAGERGARWLVRRLRRESQVEALHAAAARLSNLGPAAVAPIAEELGNDPTPDQAWALLQALGWMGESSSSPRLEDALLGLILRKFLAHPHPDVREAAARAMRLLPPEQATHWLRQREREENDPDVVQTIEEELTEHSSAGG
jgi:hypothetical protein